MNKFDFTNLETAVHQEEKERENLQSALINDTIRTY